VSEGTRPLRTRTAPAGSADDGLLTGWCSAMAIRWFNAVSESAWTLRSELRSDGRVNRIAWPSCRTTRAGAGGVCVGRARWWSRVSALGRPRRRSVPRWCRAGRSVGQRGQRRGGAVDDVQVGDGDPGPALATPAAVTGGAQGGGGGSGRSNSPRCSGSSFFFDAAGSAPFFDGCGFVVSRVVLLPGRRAVPQFWRRLAGHR
jgi:hypothetical protein